jgi:RNA polymerase subunit RPABC4/transcription elongation factor Spt4
MAYCTHCGASLPDGARFCPVCGKAVATVTARTSADGRGIIIDAPKGATVSISDGPEKSSSVEAPELKGEFTLSEWGEPVETKQAAAASKEPPSGKKGKKKKRSFLGRVFRFIFGLIITAFILLVLYWFYQGYTSV